MNFASALALLIGLFVAAPIVAHLLRRRRTEVRDFPPAHLVPVAPPLARRRSKLEDRALFGVRALVIVLLALLGAAPFVRCSRLNLGRRGGGSMAVLLVVDDSASMNAKHGSGTRLARALAGGREVLSSLREGDAVAILAAGAPARIVLATTTDLGAARRALDGLGPTDRATDLDGALALASSLSPSLPQPDKRVILLSDLADGKPGGAPLSEGSAPLWIPLAELRQRLPDCGVVRALARGREIRAHVACGAPTDAEGRSLEIHAGASVVASVKLRAERQQELELAVPESTSGAVLTAKLSGADAVAADDAAPVVAAGAALTIAVVSDLTQSGVVTGGASPVEQALEAIDETVAVRPLLTIPDVEADLAQFAAVVLDDPPGLTPEARAAFRAYLEKGGVALVMLGPRSGGAILGATFEPFVQGPVRWVTPAPPGGDPATWAALGPSAEGLAALAPRGRAVLDARADEGATVLARWLDAKPLVLSRPLGRGRALLVTLPGNVEASDLPLRPVFLELVGRVVELGRARTVGQRGVAGTPWPVPANAKVIGPTGPARVREEAGVRTLVNDRAGLYLVDVDGAVETRVAEIDEREVDLTPRAAADAALAETHGSHQASIDASPYVAFVVLLAIVAEALVRLWTRRREERDAPA